MPKLKPLVVAGMLGTPLLPASARADEVVFSPGVHLTLSFGKGLVFGVGVDLRVTDVFGKDGLACDPRDPFAGLGVFGQATWLVPDGGRFALGLHGGREIETDTSNWDVELGWAYTAKRGDWSGHGLHMGLMYSAFPFDLIARGTVSFVEDAEIIEGHLGLGARTPGVFGQDGGHCIVGRPLRVEGALQLGPVVVIGPAPRPSSRVSAATRAALGRSWLEAARAEAASVPAFIALAEDLGALGAPAPLIRRARAAAREEVEHALLCGRLASAELGVEVRALAPPIPARPRATRPEMLERLALESWHDGCLGEGAAARRAALAMKRVRADEPGAALATIARDEASHAELAWSVLGWALEAGGAEVREAVAEKLAVDSPAFEHDEESRGAATTDERTWASLGRLDARAIESARAEVDARARPRVGALIGRVGSRG